MTQPSRKGKMGQLLCLEIKAEVMQRRKPIQAAITGVRETYLLLWLRRLWQGNIGIKLRNG